MPGGEHDVQIAHGLPGQYLEKADARRRGSQQVHIVHDQHGGSGKVEALQQFQRRIASGRVIGRERRAEAAQRSRRFRRLGQTLKLPAQGAPEGAVGESSTETQITARFSRRRNSRTATVLP